MPKEQVPGKPQTRCRYTPDEKAATVRMVRTLPAELGLYRGSTAEPRRGRGARVGRTQYAGDPEVDRNCCLSVIPSGSTPTFRLMLLSRRAIPVVRSCLASALDILRSNRTKALGRRLR